MRRLTPRLRLWITFYLGAKPLYAPLIGLQQAVLHRPACFFMKSPAHEKSGWGSMRHAWKHVQQLSYFLTRMTEQHPMRSCSKLSWKLLLSSHSSAVRQRKGFSPSVGCLPGSPAARNAVLAASRVSATPPFAMTDGLAAAPVARQTGAGRPMPTIRHAAGLARRPIP